MTFSASLVLRCQLMLWRSRCASADDRNGSFSGPPAGRDGVLSKNSNEGKCFVFRGLAFRWGCPFPNNYSLQTGGEESLPE